MIVHIEVDDRVLAAGLITIIETVPVVVQVL
jgi:hypothetical protein